MKLLLITLLLIGCTHKKPTNPAYLLLLVEPPKPELTKPETQYCGRSCDWQSPKPLQDWDGTPKEKNY